MSYLKFNSSLHEAQVLSRDYDIEVILKLRFL